MQYKGKYEIFDYQKIKRYSLSERKNKFKRDMLIEPSQTVSSSELTAPEHLKSVAAAVIKAHRKKRPVIWICGAHFLKNGLSPLLLHLMRRGIITHVAGNGALAIHDFELALIGETSENVPGALGKGLFGMARETGRLMNLCINHGYSLKLGLGESLGRFINGEAFPEKADFRFPELSVFRLGYELNIPVTAHVSIGCDIIHQHPEFDGCATGGCSAIDFSIFAHAVGELYGGGVILNIGSAVTGPEILLKAISMNANIGKCPQNIVTADFDMRVAPAHQENESIPSYYFRDIKSIVGRIPRVARGTGYLIEGNHKDTLPLFYQLISERL